MRTSTSHRKVVDCYYCGQEFWDFRGLAEHVKQDCQQTPAPAGDFWNGARGILAANNVAGERMRYGMAISGKDALDRAGGGSTVLKGSDIPSKMSSITVKVTGVRDAPANFNNPILLDIDEVFGKTSWSLNKTNLKVCIAAVGDNVERLKGKSIRLTLAMTNNPKTGEMVRSLFIQSPKDIR